MNGYMDYSLSHKDFFDALMVGDRKGSSKIVKELLQQNASVHHIYENVIKMALYDIGLLWEYGKISVATEHLASAIVESLLNELYSDIISADRINRTAVVSCVENEYHQIGIKMVGDVFEMNGWNALFLGANTPTKELIKFIDTIKPDVLALSLSLYFNLPVLEGMIRDIRSEFPELPVFAGGQAFLRGGIDVLEKYPNVIYRPDLNGLELEIKKINEHE